MGQREAWRRRGGQVFVPQTAAQVYFISFEAKAALPKRFTTFVACKTLHFCLLRVVWRAPGCRRMASERSELETYEGSIRLARSLEVPFWGGTSWVGWGVQQ